ncbi:MAG: tRNA (5-methylaminomethyl-2-thiouridine)(34)-methyltransferase MnmD [Trueperaceae bacterium]|nr:tRNA (5-methylaminomethyl-2-thiouridine)(34)-methyltransferase MnmD [Truepera sp.]HRQ10069.1 tRNA (5-methylaminomethyl-2-thiouridine)(34)-methyltransferase MnmD [Trueperaceae bacterium]
MSQDPPTVIVTEDGSRTLSSARGAAYKSLHGALSEAHAVYLEGSGMAARLADGRAGRVLEVGFGAGLNFLVTAAAAQAASAPLEYVALELAPPSADTLRELRYAELLAPSTVTDALVAWRAGLGEIVASGRHVFEHGRVRLELFVGDALSPAWEVGSNWRADAIYHDAFSPSEQPELWSPEFLARLAGRLAAGGALVSFTVAGDVRRALESQGLSVSKVGGPEGGKREVLVALKPAAAT